MPNLTLVVRFQDIAREAPGAVRSYLPPYQRGVAPEACSVLVIDDGSMDPATEESLRALGPAVDVFRTTREDPAAAVDEAVAGIRTPWLAVMVDGATLLTPGALTYMQRAFRLFDRPIVRVRGFDPLPLDASLSDSADLPAAPYGEPPGDAPGAARGIGLLALAVADYRGLEELANPHGAWSREELEPVLILGEYAIRSHRAATAVPPPEDERGNMGDRSPHVLGHIPADQVDSAPASWCQPHPPRSLGRPRFHLCMANHSSTGCRSLRDHVDWIRAGLLDLGYPVTVGRRHVESGAVNLFFEYFQPGMGGFFRELRDSGYQVGVVALENFDGGGFNGLRTPEWQARFQGFLEVSAEVDFLWAGFAGSVPFYASRAPTSFLELGFSARLLPSEPPEEPAHAVGFWGKLSPHRLRLLKEIDRYFPLHLPGSFVTGEDLEAYLASIRVGVLICPSESWEGPSPNRFGRLTLSGRAALSEATPAHLAEEGPQGIVQLVPAPAPGEDLLEMLEVFVSGQWRRRATEAMERYRSEFPMGEIMERMLDETLYSPDRRERPPPPEPPTRRLVPRMVDPVLLRELEGFNLVQLEEDLFCAARKALGHVDLRRSVEDLQGEFDPEDLFFESSLAELVLRVHEGSLYRDLLEARRRTGNGG